MTSKSSCSPRDLFSSQTGAGASRVVLEIKGIPPGKKNNKMVITRLANGKQLERPLLITRPDYQKELEKITESLRFELLSASRTSDGATLTGSALRSWMLYSTPEDDAWTRIPVIQIEGRLCETGEEPGVTIVIERLS